MLSSTAYRGPFTRSAALAEAGFFVPETSVGGGMARWFPGAPPPRKTAAPRDPSGKINHRRAKAEEAALPYFVYAQRLKGIDQEAYDTLMLAYARPCRPLSAAQKAAEKARLMLAVRKAEDRRLGYPLGRLWALGLLCPEPGNETPGERDAREEHAEILEKAGRIYAAQHYLVWNGLGSQGQRVPSHLEKILTEVWGDDCFAVRAPEELDPEEIEKAWVKLKNSLAGARQLLLKAFPLGLSLKAVERLVVDKFAAEVVPNKLVKQSILKPLRAGLEALSEYYKVRKPPKRERETVVHEAPVPPPVPAPVTTEGRREARKGLPIEFDRATTPRPSPEEVARSIAMHLKCKRVPGCGRAGAG